MKRINKIEETRIDVDGLFFEQCKANFMLCERMGTHRLKIWLPGCCKLEIYDDSVDFYDMSRELLNIYKNKEIDAQKEIYLNKLKI